MKLTIFYQIVIPTTMFDKGASVELVEDVRDVVKAAFSKAFGGYTEVRGLGGYSANDGRLIQERIYEIKAWAVDRNDSVVQEMAEEPVGFKCLGSIFALFTCFCVGEMLIWPSQTPLSPP